MDLAVGPGQGKCEARGGEMALPSAVPERPSALKLLVLFFLRCFLRLACGDGGGSILGLVVLEMLGLEQTESPRPVSESSHTRGHAEGCSINQANTGTRCKSADQSENRINQLSVEISAG